MLVLLTFGILTVVTTKKNVLGIVATEFGRNFLTFSRKVLSPSSLFHHEDGGSMFSETMINFYRP